MAQILNKQWSERRKWPFYKRDAFWRGVASAFNMRGDFRPLYYGRDPRQADYEALYSDWLMTGWDMERAIRRFEKEHAKELHEASQGRLFDPDKDQG